MPKTKAGIYLRGHTWWFDAYVGGKRYRFPTGKDIKRTATAEIATTKRAAILKGEAGIARKKKDISFDKAKEEFSTAAETKNRPHTYRGYKQHLAEPEKTFGNERTLGAITPFLIEKHRQKRIADDTPVGFNRELGTLRTMINWCIDKGKYEGLNPTRKVKRINESRGSERFLEIEEEAELLAACTEPLKTMLMCGIYAGLRIPSEVLSLKKTSVDLRHGFLTIEGAFAKNGKTETVALNQKLRDAPANILARPNKSEYLFVRTNGEPYKSIQNIFRITAEKAGLSDLSPHAMRHTFASRLGEMGCDIRSIQELGRWADIRMVERYDNVSERRKKEAVAALSGNFPTIFPTPQNQNHKSYPKPVAVND